MTKDAAWPLQKAMIHHLSTDKTICKFLGNPPRIYDTAGKEGPCPKLILGDSRTRSWHSATFDGQEHDIFLHLWTEKGGAGENKEISGYLIDRLHNADFDIPGHALVDLQFQSSETRYRETEARMHCQLIFRALTVSD